MARPNHTSGQSALLSSAQEMHANGVTGAPRADWKVRAAAAARRTSNPIRQVVERIDFAARETSDPRPVLSLSIGDPTAFGNLQTNEIAAEAVACAARSGRANGYPPAIGYEESRAAVARAHSSSASGIELSAADVILASGCSHALQMCIGALADPGSNVLIPQPGFPLYRTLLESAGVEARNYPLQPGNAWNIDLELLDDLVDNQTAAIIVNNPSNPCGAVFSPEHLADLLRLCERRRIPVISDEIYDGMVFTGNQWISLASVNQTFGVPLLCVGGLAKKYLVPGWRLGWILIHDQRNSLSEVRDGLHRLATLIVGPNSLVPTALPTILQRIPPEWHTKLNHTLQQHAEFAFKALSQCVGITPYRPQGAMFIMTEIHTHHFRDVPNDVEFVQQLYSEESLAVLPGECFCAPNFFRITFCAPLPVLEDACARIASFCARRWIGEH